MELSREAYRAWQKIYRGECPYAAVNGLTHDEFHELVENRLLNWTVWTPVNLHPEARQN